MNKEINKSIGKAIKLGILGMLLIAIIPLSMAQLNQAQKDKLNQTIVLQKEKINQSIANINSEMDKINQTMINIKSERDKLISQAEGQDVQTTNSVSDTNAGPTTTITSDTSLAAAAIPSNQTYTGCVANVSRMMLPKGIIYNMTIGYSPTSPCITGDKTASFANISYINSLNTRIAKLETILTNVSRSGNDIFVNRANVHLTNGLGKTDSKNGLGNLIIGYNEPTTNGIRTGSHNIVLGKFNQYTSYGGIVAGVQNIISGTYASITGGLDNTATGNYSFVSGGMNNVASGIDSSVIGGGSNKATNAGDVVSGGSANTASGGLSSISGGYGNNASGSLSSISAGWGNTASGSLSSISAGFGNTASGGVSSVSGGAHNTASNNDASVSGGLLNIASGPQSSVSGGESNQAFNDADSVSGGLSNLASGQFSSVSGGLSNIASGQQSSVSGGGSNQATFDLDSISGGSANIANGEASSISGGSGLSEPTPFGWAAGSIPGNGIFVGTFESD